MSCAQTFTDYALRAIGYGERALPKADITLCDQVILIGSGMMWNIYYAVIALILGFFCASFIAFARNSNTTWVCKLAASFIFIIRGSPLFIQFFIAYELFVLLPKLEWAVDLGFTELTLQTRWLARAWLGAVVVLFLNTTAYTAQIFYGALQSVPKGDIEAARAIGMSKRQINKRIIWPTMLRLAWASYTNEAIFLFHATTLVLFSSFPAWQQKGDALYYASYFADRTFNPFVAYPIVAGYFVIFTILIIIVFGIVGKRFAAR